MKTARTKRPWLLGAALLATASAPSLGAEHPGAESIAKTGYHGPSTCEECHPGVAKAFLQTVHWTHASKAEHVEGVDPAREYGMKNRIYTMCNGNDVVNDLKEIPPSPETGKTKFSGCNTCHPGNHLSNVGSTGPEAEAAIDCLLCHSSKYDYRKRKPYKDEQGRVVMGQDRSAEAALAVGRPGVKNCMVCHEAAGGGVLIKRGFAFTPATDVHAAKKMICVDCHRAKDHRVPTGFDPNNWASDGVRLSCEGCHKDAPHADADYNRHTARIACQTCHIPRTGGAFAKDFTRWTQGSDKFYEPTTLRKEANETVPVYAWFNQTVLNSPSYIGPKGNRSDARSKIYPFKIFEGKAFFDRKTGALLAMDFAPPMATGDTLAGVASAARTLGLSSYDPVPGWQTVYFASSHLVTKEKALTCSDCHAANGVLDFRGLGYSEAETARLTSAALYFDKLAQKLKEEW
ncbi:MAG: cytochrome C [Deltaproteobacteria bacterium]|nr:cytochrome C [Deltaproteobacteria bacterium]